MQACASSNPGLQTESEPLEAISIGRPGAGGRGKRGWLDEFGLVRHYRQVVRTCDVVEIALEAGDQQRRTSSDLTSAHALFWLLDGEGLERSLRLTYLDGGTEVTDRITARSPDSFVLQRELNDGTQI